ncbi:MAG: DUF2321 domain-containing protein [Acidobacteriaceae bacterium]
MEQHPTANISWLVGVLTDFSFTHSTQRTCLNGHVISNEADAEEGMTGQVQVWCHSCGSATIDRCPSCKGPLRGDRKAVFLTPSPKPDAYCVHCGKALPWTESHLEAVREVAQYVEAFDEEDRKMLVEILPDLASQESTPRTQIGIVKMKLLFKKGGSIFFDAANKILVDVVSETVRKSLFPH